MLRAAIFLMAACFSAQCMARELTLYLMDVPPLTMNTPERKGVVGDIVLEAMRRAGYTPKLVVMPNNRALAVVANPGMADALIIPLARIPDREEKFTWVAPVVKVNRAFFTLDKTVNSFDEARAALASIGVSRGTAGVSILRAAGIPSSQIYELNQGEPGFRMLLARRIDAWYGPVAEGRTLRTLVDADERVLISPPLGASYNYLGCSRVCGGDIVERLSEALVSMDKDGSTKTILRRYGALD